MNGIKKLIKKIWNDETKKIAVYAWKPAHLTVIYGLTILILLVLGIIITGNFENFIVSTDIKYNSPMIKWMMFIFIITVVISFIYGVSLCLYKYKRPGKKIKNGKYVEGSSYKALSHTFDNK